MNGSSSQERDDVIDDAERVSDPVHTKIFFK